jgi:single-strand DNA-binding protein
MSSFNKVTLLGRLGKEPELKTVGENMVCNFSLATSRKAKGQDLTDWHNITAWGKTAEVCAKYLSKGSRVLLDGRIEYRTYEKDGEKKYATSIVAETVTFVDTKGDKENAQVPSDTPKKEYSDDLPF